MTIKQKDIRAKILQNWTRWCDAELSVRMAVLWAGAVIPSLRVEDGAQMTVCHFFLKKEKEKRYMQLVAFHSGRFVPRSHDGPAG